MYVRAELSAAGRAVHGPSCPRAELSGYHICDGTQMCRRTEEEVGPPVGLPRHRHFVGFFNVLVVHRHGTTLFIRWFRQTAPFSRLLRSRWGYGGHILDLTPGLSRGLKSRNCPPYPHAGRRYIAQVADWVELNWLFNVTINDISVIHVTAHRCAGGLKKKLDLRSGSHAIDIS